MKELKMVTMPKTSTHLPSNLPLIPSSSLLTKTYSIKYNTYHHLLNFGVANFPSKLPKLRVKIDDVQHPCKINNTGKNEDHEVAKGNYVYDDYVVRQNFLVRLYELDVHQKASLEALLNYTEETGLNLFQSSGIVVGGFGVSKEMSSRNLIWVIGRTQVLVTSYPSWGDVVQVETWCSALGKHSLTISSRLTDAKTGAKIMRVDSEFVMINEITRRLSRLPEVIKARGEPYVRENFDPLIFTNKSDDNNKHRKLQKLDVENADYIQKGIRPLWIDLDPNQHVNNAKYISWILEGVPDSMRRNNEVEAITLEYRRECLREDVLQSLSSASKEVAQEFDHSLRLEEGTEVARARTLWRSKPIINP